MTSFATSTKAKVGLLRNSELMQMSDTLKSPNDSTTVYSWLLTPRSNTTSILTTNSKGFTSNLSINHELYIKPALNLKENVIITGGTGTKENTFTLELN